MAKIFIDDRIKEMVDHAAKLKDNEKQLYGSISKDAIKIMRAYNPHISSKTLENYFQSLVTVAKSKLAFKSAAEQAKNSSSSFTPRLSNILFNPISQQFEDFSIKPK